MCVCVCVCVCAFGPLVRCGVVTLCVRRPSLLDAGKVERGLAADVKLVSLTPPVLRIYFVLGTVTMTATTLFGNASRR